MKALIVPEKGRLELADVPQPEIGPFEALVKTEVCGICSSTDWKIIQGQMNWAGPFPLILGHESVGTIVRTGERAKQFRVGDRVTRVVNPERPNLNTAMGGFAEFGVVTDARAMADAGDDSMLQDYTALRQQRVPPSLDPVHAALAISLAETASALQGLGELRGKSVVVAGTGIAGLAFTLWAKLAGARVVILGRREERVQRGKRVGANAGFDTTDASWPEMTTKFLHGQTDIVIDAIGDVRFAAELLALLKPDGLAAAYGAPPGDDRYPSRFQAMDAREHLAIAWVADLLERGWVRPEWFVSHMWELSQAPEAFEQVRRGEVLKGFVLFA